MESETTPPFTRLEPSLLGPRSLLVCAVLLTLSFAAGRYTARDPAKPAAPAEHPAQSSGTNANSLSRLALHQGEWDETWLRLSSHPRTPAGDNVMMTALTELAENDPTRALSIALQERHRQRQALWLQAVLRGWARLAPSAAAAWAETRPFAEREELMQAVMEGAIQNPTAAVALTDNLIRMNPAGARSYTNHLLRALNETGDFERAVAFTSRLPPDVRAEMLGTAFQYWALSQPEPAFARASALPAGEARTAALDAAISGWAKNDPAGLATFALGIHADADRTAALQTALREWVLLNPKAASDWIDRFDPKPEFDAGAAAVAQHPDVISRQPEIAASWAESITDPALRSATLVHVLREWSGKNIAAALAYARQTTVLPASDRLALLDELSPHETATHLTASDTP